MWWMLICLWSTLVSSKVVFQDWASYSLGLCGGQPRVKCSQGFECVRRIGYETNGYGLCRETGDLGTSCGGIRINPNTLRVYRGSTNCKLGLTCKQSRRFPNVPGKCLPI